MLMMTRRAGQKIVVGDGITIEIVEIVGNTVRLGVDAPRSVPVYREEIWTAVRAENEAAATAATSADRAAVGSAPARGRRRRVGGARPESSQSAVSPSAIRSATSAAASTRPRDLGVALAPAAEHVGGDDVGVARVRPPDADPHAGEVGRAEALAQRLQAVVAGQPAADTAADVAELQVDLVVEDEYAVEVDVQRAPGRAGRAPGLVHVGLRAEHRHARAGRRSPRAAAPRTPGSARRVEAR